MPFVPTWNVVEIVVIKHGSLLVNFQSSMSTGKWQKDTIKKVIGISSLLEHFH